MAVEIKKDAKSINIATVLACKTLPKGAKVVGLVFRDEIRGGAAVKLANGNVVEYYGGGAHSCRTLPAVGSGGANRGQGRKPKGETKPVSMRLLLEGKDRLDRLVESTGKTQADVVQDALTIYDRLPPEERERLLEEKSS